VAKANTPWASVDGCGGGSAVAVWLQMFDTGRYVRHKAHGVLHGTEGYATEQAPPTPSKSFRNPNLGPGASKARKSAAGCWLVVPSLKAKDGTGPGLSLPVAAAATAATAAAKLQRGSPPVRPHRRINPCAERPRAR
jgi:hypothetical protein